jgi:hypothetical protein
MFFFEVSIENSEKHSPEHGGDLFQKICRRS